MSIEIGALAILIFAIALLYSSVGQAGASGYLAAMALVGLAPEQMKPAALSLNVLVATIATIRFGRAGCFSWRLFWPFAVTSIPFAFIGGGLQLPGWIFKPMVGAILMFAAYRLLFTLRGREETARKRVPLAAALALGSGIGLLSGLVGIGGGILLCPLLLCLAWADARRAAGVSAVFVLVNSMAALAGHLNRLHSLPSGIGIWALAAMGGGIVGSGLGARRFDNRTLLRILGALLAVAGLKMLLSPLLG